MINIFGIPNRNSNLNLYYYYNFHYYNKLEIGVLYSNNLQFFYKEYTNHIFLFYMISCFSYHYILNLIHLILKILFPLLLNHFFDYYYLLFELYLYIYLLNLIYFLFYLLFIFFFIFFLFIYF